MSIRIARAKAEDVIKKWGKYELPVDVKGVGKSLGLQVIEMALDKTISGLLVSNDKVAHIVVNKNDPLVRRRFTIAHEIGHYVLQHQFESGSHVHVDKGIYVSQRGLSASTGVDLKEIEANQIKYAELLNLCQKDTEQFPLRTLF